MWNQTKFLSFSLFLFPSIYSFFYTPFSFIFFLSSSIPIAVTLVGETTFTTHPVGVTPQSCPSNQSNKLSYFNFSNKHGIEQNFLPPIFFLLSSSFSTPFSLFFSFSFPIVGPLVGETTFTTHPARATPQFCPSNQSHKLSHLNFL